MILGNHSRKLLKDKHHLLDNFAQGFSCQHKHSTTQGVIRKATKGVWVQINIMFSYCKLRSVSSWCFESCRLICVCAQSLTGVWLFATPWTVAHQAPLSMGFQRQEYRSGLPFLSPGDLLNPGIKPASPVNQSHLYQIKNQAVALGNWLWTITVSLNNPWISFIYLTLLTIVWEKRPTIWPPMKNAGLRHDSVICVLEYTFKGIKSA